MRCIVCDNDAWENVDQFRLKKEGMSLCKSCGFISYPSKWKEKKEIIQYYRGQYRQAPTVDNLYQGQRKLNYHQEFLVDPVFTKWKAEEKKDPVIFDVGAAYGLVLAWFKNMKNSKGELLYPKADVSGSELTLSYRRVAYHEFGFDLKEDFDDTKEYDLICSYKVAEHMMDADKELKRYAKCLKKDGFLYVSVPTWFNRLHNFGVGGFSIEYYYSPDHINSWTILHFLRVLKKAGFRVVKENHAYYDSTYLCQVGDWDTNFPEEGPDKIRDYLDRVKRADELCQKKQFEQALEAWPNFPIARRALYEYNRRSLHEQGVDAIIAKIVKPWIEIDPHSYDAYTLGADILMRYDRFDDALKYLKEALDRKPKCDVVLGAIANCYRVLAQKAPSKAESAHFTSQSLAIMRFMKENCLNSFANATTWIYNDMGNLPMPSEKVNA